MMRENEIQTHLKYPDVRALLDFVLTRAQKILGEKLVGLYLYGSLVAGDFDYEISDVDLLAAVADELNDDEFRRLERMHGAAVEKHPRWKNRLEIAYVARRALKTFKTRCCRISIISPGEPFHRKEAGEDWLLNWHFVRENGVTLFGAPPETIVAPVSKEEFVCAVRRQAAEWRGYVVHTKSSRPYQAYAILTLCRAFYAIENGDQVSKRVAARWTQARLPEFHSLIENALEWRAARQDENVNHETTFPETEKFVLYVISRIAK